MSTESSKKVSTLVDDFVRRPKEFENYSKHCLNMLRNYVWLKEHQFDNQISNYDYMIKMIQNYGVGHYEFERLYEQYNRNVVDCILEEKKCIVHSNIYYYNQLDDFTERIIHGERLLENDTLNMKFSQLDYVVIMNDKNFNFEKEYTYDEIFNLVLDHKIIVLDCFISDRFILRSEAYQSYHNCSRFFVDNNCCECLGINSKVIDQFYSFPNVDEKRIWGTIYESFCFYFRKELVIFEYNTDVQNFKFNVNYDFYKVIDHILEVTNELCKYYRKRKKSLPKIIQKTVFDNKIIIESVKMEFEKNFNVESSEKMYVLV